MLRRLAISRLRSMHVTSATTITKPRFVWNESKEQAQQAETLCQAAEDLKLLLLYGKRYEPVDPIVTFDSLRSKLKEIESQYETLTGEALPSNPPQVSLKHVEAEIRALGYARFLLQKAGRGDEGMARQHEDLIELHRSAAGKKIENDGFGENANRTVAAVN